MRRCGSGPRKKWPWWWTSPPRREPRRRPPRATYRRLAGRISRKATARKARAIEYEEYLNRIADLGKRVEAGHADDTPEQFDTLYHVNIRAQFFLTQALLPTLIESRGAIVNMSSVNGRLAIPTIASYNVSKGGIDQLTRVMALALAEHGVRVNAVAPGTIATELAR